MKSTGRCWLLVEAMSDCSGNNVGIPVWSELATETVKKCDNPFPCQTQCMIFREQIAADLSLSLWDKSGV